MFLDSLIELDRQLTLAINSLHTPFMDGVWHIVSNIPVWIPMYVAIIACLFWRLGWKRALVFTAVLALMVLCSDQLANLFKNTVCRLRPCHDETMLAAGLHVPFGRGGLYGFFSGHASNSFAMSAASTTAMRTDTRLRYRGFVVWMYLWCCLVSVSRIFLARHFLGDILVWCSHWVCLRSLRPSSLPENATLIHRIVAAGTKTTRFALSLPFHYVHGSRPVPPAGGCFGRNTQKGGFSFSSRPLTSRGWLRFLSPCLPLCSPLNVIARRTQRVRRGNLKRSHDRTKY